MADQKDAVAEVSTPKKIANFFKESKVELHKVTWPTKRGAAGGYGGSPCGRGNRGGGHLGCGYGVLGGDPLAVTVTHEGGRGLAPL